MKTFYIVKLKQDPGPDLFYTGRAGEGWLNDSLECAFPYSSEFEARLKTTGPGFRNGNFAVERVELFVN